MKSWIKKYLRDSLNEVKPKPIFGSGLYHDVYSSNKNPNSLYKIGRKRVVEEWVEIFNKYPKLFPKVYRVFPSRKDPNYFIVEIEKLNNDDVKTDWRFMQQFLINSNIYLYDDDENDLSDRVNFNYIYLYPKDLLLDKLRDFIYSNKISHDTYLLFEKWIEFTNELFDVLKRDLDKDGLDFHAGNFAYDKNGNLKCIDI